MDNFKVKECKKCGFEVEEIDEGIYFCHNCEKQLCEKDIREDDLITDGYIKKCDDGTIEAKGLINIFNLLNS